MKVKNQELIFNKGKDLSESAIAKFLEIYLNCVGRLILQLTPDDAHRCVLNQLKKLDDEYIGEKSCWEILVSSHHNENKKEINNRLDDGSSFKVTIQYYGTVTLELPGSDSFTMIFIQNETILHYCYKVYSIIFEMLGQESEDMNYPEENPNSLQIVTTHSKTNQQITHCVLAPQKEEFCVLLFDNNGILHGFYKNIQQKEIDLIQKEVTDPKLSGPVLGRLYIS